MLNVLFAAEREMPDLLADESAWTGLYADSERPALTRLWRQWGEYRVYLHAFDPCEADEVFCHPHPWAFAVRIHAGTYEMSVSHGAEGREPDEVVKMILAAGSCYEMTCRSGLHGVRPVGTRCLSLMVAGPVIWPEHRIVANTPTRDLHSYERAHLFTYFRSRYPYR